MIRFAQTNLQMGIKLAGTSGTSHGLVFTATFLVHRAHSDLRR